MNFNEFNNFEEFAKKFGYTSDSGCNDIKGGFQDLNPEIFTVIGELLGNVMAGNLPFNVQNAVGNWLQLVGQAILTYNAQQQYFEGGPGNYYNTTNKNVNNSNCTQNNNTENSSNSSNKKHNNIKNNSTDVDKLKENIDTLTREVQELKKDMERIRKGYTP